MTAQGMLNCLDAGVDTIIHARHHDENGNNVYRPDVTERILKQGAMVNMTIYGTSIIINATEEKKAKFGLTPEEQAVQDHRMKMRDFILESFFRMHKAGVKMAAGSDAAWGKHTLGQFHNEVVYHVKGGMTAMQALTAATLNAAKSCWIDDKVGSLEPGKEVDILVVNGDPSRDVADLKNVVDVFQAGRKVDRGSAATAGTGHPLERLWPANN